MSPIKPKNFTEAALRKVKKSNLKKLAGYRAKGFTKDQLYSKFPKIFVDKNY